MILCFVLSYSVDNQYILCICPFLDVKMSQFFRKMTFFSLKMASFFQAHKFFSLK